MKRLITKLDHFLDHHLLILVLLTLVVLLRLPSLFEPFWYGDENIYLAIGQGIKKGLTLYSSITDFPNKPPLIYYLAAAAGSVSNFRLLLLFWTLATTALFHQLALRFSRSRLVTLFSTLIFIFLTSTPIIEGNIANAENFFILPTLLSVYFLTSRPKSKTHLISNYLPFHFLAGLSLGFSFLFKIHVALDIAAIGLFFYLLTRKFDKTLLKQTLLNPSPWLFALGLALPIAATLAYFYTLGVSPQSLFLNAIGSSGYVSVWQASDLINQYLLFGSLQARGLLLLILTIVLFVLRKSLPPKVLLLALWFIFALFAVLLSTRPYPHYLIQLAPPLVLALAVLLSHFSLKAFLANFGLAVLLIASLIRFDFSFWEVGTYYHNFYSYAIGSIDRNEYYRRFDSRMPRNYALALYIRKITPPGDQIYIWGTEPGVYVLSDRLPVVIVKITSFHVADLDYYDATITALDKEKPSVIVYMESETRQFNQLSALLGTQYSLVAKIGDPDKTCQENRGHHALVYKRL